MNTIELDELLVSLLFTSDQRDRLSRLIPNVLNKICRDLEIPLFYMDYCRIVSRKGKTVTYIKESVPRNKVTVQGLLISLIVVFEDSKLIDIKGTLQDYIMEQIS